jgi:hypothetical protein
VLESIGSDGKKKLPKSPKSPASPKSSKAVEAPIYIGFGSMVIDDENVLRNMMQTIANGKCAYLHLLLFYYMFI